jgi:two-component system invasion response regulator UvrY
MRGWPVLVITMINVLLVDDHPLMRRLLREMLETYTDLTIVGEAETGEEAVVQVARLQPSVVIMDIHLPRLNGIQATKLIKAKSLSTAVIGLTAGEPIPEEKQLLFAAGGAALINKGEALISLHRSIHEAVASQKRFIDDGKPA